MAKIIDRRQNIQIIKQENNFAGGSCLYPAFSFKANHI